MTTQVPSKEQVYREALERIAARNEHPTVNAAHALVIARNALDEAASAHEPSPALETIAATLQHWLDFHASQTSTPSDDCTMVRMPVSPTRRTIKAWVAALRSSAQPPGADEVAWVIEFTAFPEPLYFGGVDEGTTVAHFDKDHLKAVRFARKQDGETMLRVLKSARRRDYEDSKSFPRLLPLADDCYAVTEHMWCSVPTKISEQP